MTLTRGTQLGPYVIDAPLGAGGTGEVYRARDTRLERPVAIKILPSHVGGDPQVRERFDREVKVLAALSHPNIVAIHDVGALRGESVAALDWLERAYDAGWRDARTHAHDPLLASINREPRFARLVSRIEADVAAMRARADYAGLGLQ